MFIFLRFSLAWERVMGNPNKQWGSSNVLEVGLDQSVTEPLRPLWKRPEKLSKKGRERKRCRSFLNPGLTADENRTSGRRGK